LRGHGSLCILTVSARADRHDGGAVLVVGRRISHRRPLPRGASGDPDEAEASFDFGAGQYPAIDGIGDRAYNSQPIGDVDVLAGPYEVSVSLYFASDDDAAELAMAGALAALVIDRLP
jgi:hypothetical protein